MTLPRDFIEDFMDTAPWAKVPAKFRFRCQKEVNVGMKEKHRLALTMRGVVERSLDDTKGLQTLNYEGYQIFEKGDLVFKLIDLQNIKTSRVGLVPRRGIMSPAYIRLTPLTNDVTPEFYFWYFYAAYVGNIFNGIGGGVRQTLNSSDLLQLSIPDISRPEQEAITSFLDREITQIDALIGKKEHLVTALNAKLRIAITSAVTSGINAAAATMYSGTDWIGQIPQHWAITKLGYLGRFANGINIGGDAFGSGYPFYSYGDVYKNRILPQVPSGLVQSSETDRKSYTVRAGDVFFTRTSETIEEVGFSSVCMETIDNAVFAGFLIRFRPRTGQLHPLFSKYAFQHSGLRDYFAREMNLITRASLSQDLLRNMPVALPPPDDQEAIACHLDDLETSIGAIVEKTTATIIKLKERRATLITAAVTGQIDVDSYGKAGATSATLDRIEGEMQQ